MNADKKLEYIELLDALSEALGDSEGQTPEEIRLELREEGFDIDSAENELLRFRNELSAAARREVLDEAKIKREALNSRKQGIIDKFRGWTRAQIDERLKDLLNKAPDVVVAYRDLETQKDEDVMAILVDLEMAKLMDENEDASS